MANEAAAAPAASQMSAAPPAAAAAAPLPWRRRLTGAKAGASPRSSGSTRQTAGARARVRLRAREARDPARGGGRGGAPPPIGGGGVGGGTRRGEPAYVAEIGGGGDGSRVDGADVTSASVTSRRRSAGHPVGSPESKLCQRLSRISSLSTQMGYYGTLALLASAAS